jgi:hypothetical protein
MILARGDDGDWNLTIIIPYLLLFHPPTVYRVQLKFIQEPIHPTWNKIVYTNEWEWKWMCAVFDPNESPPMVYRWVESNQVYGSYWALLSSAYTVNRTLLLSHPSIPYCLYVYSFYPGKIIELIRLVLPSSRDMLDRQVKGWLVQTSFIS